MDDEPLAEHPENLPAPPPGDDAAGVVAAAEALVEAAALEVDLDATAADLDGVDAALRRLDDGTYGTCEVCSVELPDDVLAADPTTRRCPVHVLARSLPGTALPSSLPPGPDADAGADAGAPDDAGTPDGAGTLGDGDGEGDDEAPAGPAFSG